MDQIINCRPAGSTREKIIEVIKLILPLNDIFVYYIQIQYEDNLQCLLPFLSLGVVVLTLQQDLKYVYSAVK